MDAEWAIPMTRFNLYAEDAPAPAGRTRGGHRIDLARWVGLGLMWAALVFVATLALLAV